MEVVQRNACLKKLLNLTSTNTLLGNSYPSNYNSTSRTIEKMAKEIAHVLDGDFVKGTFRSLFWFDIIGIFMEGDAALGVAEESSILRLSFLSDLIFLLIS